MMHAIQKDRLVLAHIEMLYYDCCPVYTTLWTYRQSFCPVFGYLRKQHVPIILGFMAGPMSRKGKGTTVLRYYHTQTIVENSMKFSIYWI